jgi:hypothetical protein
MTGKWADPAQLLTDIQVFVLTRQQVVGWKPFRNLPTLYPFFLRFRTDFVKLGSYWCEQPI